MPKKDKNLGPFGRNMYPEETSSGWGCPHELGGKCKLTSQPCKPGVKGCILHQYMKKNEPDEYQNRE